MGKLLFLILSIVVILAGAIFGLTTFLVREDTLEKADAIVAVSGGDTKARAAKAIELYTNNYASLLVFSGAAKDPNSPSNARVMQDMAIQAGVPSGAIAIDEYSRDTRENAVGIKQYIGDSRKIILVTSEYHQRRAHKEIQTAVPDVEIIDAPADDKNWSPLTWWLTPYGWWITIGELGKNAF